MPGLRASRRCQTAVAPCQAETVLRYRNETRDRRNVEKETSVLDHISLFCSVAGLTILLTVAPLVAGRNDDRIRPYEANPRYWQYKGEPLLLLGGSKDDNLFQIPDLAEHLDAMKAAGANYIRNTMSDRKDLGFEVYPYKQVGEDMYDLDQWNEEYWYKLKFFFDETGKRDIIVHLTLWDHFDLSGYGRFSRHPLNPENNINWAPGTIKNATDYYGGSLATNNEPVLGYQHRFVDRVISLSAGYGHIFYNIANESGLGADWDNYWALYIKEAAARHGREIHVTTMLFTPDNSVRRVMNYRNIYSFAEVSQNNQDALGPVGKKHWENLLFWRKMIAMSNEGPMPVTRNGINTTAMTGGVRNASLPSIRAITALTWQ